MAEHFLFGITVTLIHLSGAYLRYLPFSREMSDEEILKLRERFLSWSVFNAALYSAFSIFGVGLDHYAKFFILGWLPYVFISVTVIRNKPFQHVFVCGMQGLWNFMLQVLASMVVKAIYGDVLPQYLQLHMMIDLVIFMLLLPIERKVFVNLLPAQNFFETPFLKWYVSLLPVAVLFGTAIPILNTGFFPTWQKKISHLIIPFFFFMMYRSLGIYTQQAEAEQRREQTARLMRQQFLSLREHNALMQKSRHEVEELRKDLGKNYREVDKFLNEGNIKAAMAYIREQDALLDKTAVKKFCDAPLVNAALSIYFSRAEDIGVKLKQKINLPENFSTDENDLAILLSNLLENAIQASERQEINRREISVIFQHKGGQCVLEIENRYDFPVKLGENDLPCTAREGHGLGMTSLENFVKKYDAYADFSQSHGLVKVSMYWQD